MKKILTLILASAIAASSCAALASCSNNKDEKKESVQNTTVEETEILDLGVEAPEDEIVEEIKEEE